jgi:hypothetical protein
MPESVSRRFVEATASWYVVVLRGSLIVFPLLLAGCGSHERVVAWRDHPLPQARPPSRALVPALPTHARFCGGRSLSFRTGNSQPLNSTMAVHWFEVRNHGRTTCALAGRPAVTVLRSGGYPVRIAQLPGKYGEARFAERTFGLRPGHSAALALFVGSACSVARIRRTSALIELDAVEHAIRLPLSTCRYGLNLALEPFQPTDSLPAARPWRFPLRVEIGRLHARRGTTLVYRVRLRNLSPRPFRFPPTWCPIVNEWIGGQNGPVFELNCRPAGTIAPHGGIVFVMHYRLSRHYLPGLRTLHWTLSNEIDERQVGTKTTLRIDP